MAGDSGRLDDLPTLADDDLKPNFTQFPNVLLDRVLPLLRLGEQAVLWYLVRRTYGFHQGTAEVGLSEIMHGTRGADGHRLNHGAGLSKNTAMDSIRSLISRQVIEVVGSGARGVRRYRINMRASEWQLGESENSTGAKIAPVVTGPETAPDPVQESRRPRPAEPSTVRNAGRGKREKETMMQPEEGAAESLFPVDAPVARASSAHAREGGTSETHTLV